MAVLAAEKRIRTTISLPASLMESLDSIVSEQHLFSNRTELFETAIRHHLKALERQLIDHQFSQMAFDVHYQTQASRIADEFEGSEPPIVEGR